MLGFIKGAEEKPAGLPSGDAEIIFCVFDDKQRLHHCYRSARAEAQPTDRFQFLNDPSTAFNHSALRDAVRTNQPTSVTVSVGEGRRTFLSVLPYERKRKKWRYACVQISTMDADPATAASARALAEDRVGLVLVDGKNYIRSVGPRVPEAFGYASQNLMGLSLGALFADSDFERIRTCPADARESVHHCVLQSPDGGRCDVELRKLSAPDQYTLYGIIDVTQPQFTEEIAEAGLRERRRIGQDLHDSIGQLLTGISLLSRSLANSLTNQESSDFDDASQISELADEASNQIRQISRSLMPPEIVQQGLCEALRELARVTTASCGVACEVQFEDAIEFACGD